MKKYLEMTDSELKGFIKSHIFNTCEHQDRASINLEYLLLDAIRWQLWRNGIMEEVYTWKDLDTDEGWILCPSKKYGTDEWCETYGWIWTFIIDIFGNYGTSPRFGWIEEDEVPAFKRFIELIAYPDSEYFFED